MSRLEELKKLKSMVDIEVTGKENIPKDSPCVIISNHNRLLDIMYLPTAFDEDIISLVSARLVYKPDFTRLIYMRKYLNAFPIEAHGGQNYAIMCLSNSSYFLSKGLSVSIFPEGAYIDDQQHVYKGRTGAARILFDSLESCNYAYLLPVAVDVQSNSELDNYIPSSNDKVKIKICEPIVPDSYLADWVEAGPIEERNAVLHKITDDGMKTIASALGREYVDKYIDLRPKGNIIFSNGKTVKTEEAQTTELMRKYDKELKTLRFTLSRSALSNQKN